MRWAQEQEQEQELKLEECIDGVAGAWAVAVARWLWTDM